MKKDDANTMETGFSALLTLEEEAKKNDLVVKLSKINVKNLNTNDEIISKENNERIEIDSVLRKESYVKDNEDWSPNAISLLLNAWQEKNKNECSRHDIDGIWKEISEVVNGRLGNSKKSKDYEQCKTRFKTMQGRYNREKMAKKFNPNESNSWEWYDTMNTINTLFIEIPSYMPKSINTINTKKVCDVTSNPSNLKCCEVKDNHVEKCIVEETAPKKSLSLDLKGKLQYSNSEQNFDTKVHEGQNTYQYNKLPTPTSKKSPRSLLEVKWRDSNSSQKNLIDKFKKENSQESMLNLKPLEYQDEQKKVLLVNEIKEKLKYDEQNTSNHNGNVLDIKGKSTFKTFDSCSDNYSSYTRSVVMDQDSATSSPLAFITPKSNYKANKYNDTNSFSHKTNDDQDVNRFSVMELSRSINCNYKQICVESVTNNKCSNKNKEILKEDALKVGEQKSHIFGDLRRRNETLATNIGRENEQMALSSARADSMAHSLKTLSTTGSPIASLTSQSGSSFSSRQKKRFHVSSKYRFERENQSTRSLITTLMRATNSVPRSKKRNRFPNHTSYTHDSNMVTVIMTFGAKIQQLEKNHIVLVERVLSEQSTVLNDFVKTLKYNDQIREITLVGLLVKFLLSVFLIGIILYGTSKTTSTWVPLNFQSSNWCGSSISNNDLFSQIAWIGCFIIVLLTQLLWTSFKRRPMTP